MKYNSCKTTTLAGCVYTHFYIYIYGTPPQRSTKFNATTDIVGYFRLQDCPEVCWQNLGSRLKPIEPIEISIGTKIQGPRFPGKTPEQSWILDLGSEPRLKCNRFNRFQSAYRPQACPHDHPCTHTSIHCKVIFHNFQRLYAD